MGASDIGGAALGATKSLFSSEIPGTDAKGLQQAQQKQIAEQKRKEDLRLAEETSALKKKQAVVASGRGGKRSLIATSPTGLKQTLGS